MATPTTIGTILTTCGRAARLGCLGRLLRQIEAYWLLPIGRPFEEGTAEGNGRLRVFSAGGPALSSIGGVYQTILWTSRSRIDISPCIFRTFFRVRPEWIEPQGRRHRQNKSAASTWQAWISPMRQEICAPGPEIGARPVTAARIGVRVNLDPLIDQVHDPVDRYVRLRQHPLQKVQTDRPGSTTQ